MKNEITKIRDAFLKDKRITTKALSSRFNLDEQPVRIIVCKLRQGTKQRKDGTYRREPMNIQSVKTSGLNRTYELMDENTKAEDYKFVITRTMKYVSSLGKHTFKPCTKGFVHKVPTTEAKKFILGTQEMALDSMMLDYKGK